MTEEAMVEGEITDVVVAGINLPPHFSTSNTLFL